MMTVRTITFVRDDHVLEPTSSSAEIVVPLVELKRWVATGSLFRRLFRFQFARYVVPDLRFIHLPFKMGIALRLVSRRRCWFEDDHGARKTVTIWFLIARLLIWLGELLYKPIFLRSFSDEVKRQLSEPRVEGRTIDLSLPPLYLRANLDPGLRAGGSVSHTAGVVNNLDRFTGRPLFLTPTGVPGIRSDIETAEATPAQRFWDFPELPHLYFDRTLTRAADRLVATRRFSLIYHRYRAGSFSAVKVSRRLGIPLVLEYNGSEVWVARHWGSPYLYEDLALSVEDLVIHSATMIVVVSTPLRDELIQRNVDPERVLVDPNGVDPALYNPDVDGEEIRARYGFEDKCVIGFIGSFGPWHGAEILAASFGKLVADWPEQRERLRLLLVGDGSRHASVREAAAAMRIDDICTFTGVVSQEDGPAHLAACDILVSPHVENPDGTPFFGSPTKLFEYMAMAKPIVASALGQIAEVLEHEHTALLVTPGNLEELTHAIKRLIEDRELGQQLGRMARCEVIANYTWEIHVGRIIKKLTEICA